jgi:hypothetical protein
VGTRIRARGAFWRVTARTDRAVHLEAYEEEPVDGAPTPTGPTIVPAALGDEPLIIEILPAA